MKKYYFLMALAATAIMSACSTDNEFAPQTSGEKVNFFVDNGPITRTIVNTTDGTTKFVAGDEIGITATGSATATNSQYKVGDANSGELTEMGSAIEWTGTEAGSFYAYYPYAANAVDAGKVTFIVGDQTDEDSFNKNDFLTASAPNVKNKTAINFKFAHGLSLVQVAFTGSDAASATAVTIKAQPTVEWTYATNTYAAAGTATDIKMWKVGEGNFWAVVPAQTITGGTVMMAIEAGGKNYTYTPTGNIDLKTGYSKKFTLKLGEAGQAISVATDIDTGTWTPDTEETGELKEEIVPPVELISAAEITSDTPFALQTGKQNCVKGWNYIMVEANGSAVKDEGESAFAIKKLATGEASWYNGTIYYCTEAGKATRATYKLTFKVKALEEADIQVAVMAKESGNRWFVSGPSTTRYAKATTADYKSVEMDFDLSKITGGNAAAATASTAEDVNEVLVYFTPKDKSDTNTFYIKDVTFIEVKE